MIPQKTGHHPVSGNKRPFFIGLARTDGRIFRGLFRQKLTLGKILFIIWKKTPQTRPFAEHLRPTRALAALHTCICKRNRGGSKVPRSE